MTAKGNGSHAHFENEIHLKQKKYEKTKYFKNAVDCPPFLALQ
jgi:hypothetical protein|tara:strand:- start:13 stop:141 length:129 start_codon:yes stop_codon:yes gene_type:complete